MDDATIAEALDRAEAAVAAGAASLEGTGFWPAVGALRRDPAAADRFADRVATIDRRAFRQGVRARVPVGVGNLVLGAGTIGAILLLVFAGRNTIAFLVAFGALTITTHSLTHWIVGRILGMRFTHYFLGGPTPPRPGVKLDYATYLRVPARKRAWMHASGAIVTKLVPFVLIPIAGVLGRPGWILWTLVAVGVAQILTDVLISTKASDWKKFRREMTAAKATP